MRLYSEKIVYIYLSTQKSKVKTVFDVLHIYKWDYTHGNLLVMWTLSKYTVGKFLHTCVKICIYAKFTHVCKCWSWEWGYTVQLEWTCPDPLSTAIVLRVDVHIPHTVFHCVPLSTVCIMKIPTVEPSTVFHGVESRWVTVGDLSHRVTRWGRSAPYR